MCTVFAYVHTDDVIQSLNSLDDEERDQAIAKADKLLDSSKALVTKRETPDRTGVNRTVINKDAFKPIEAQPPAQQYTVRGKILVEKFLHLP